MKTKDETGLSCNAKGCKSMNASPYITKSVLELSEGERQPVWRCPTHKPRKEVSYDGQEKSG